MPIKDYTTKVPTTRTVAEIMELLSRHGAQKITTEYFVATNPPYPIGLRFTLKTPIGDYEYVLPANVEGVQRTLQRDHADKRVPAYLVTKEQAVRVAWRILKDWTEAQMAIIEEERKALPPPSEPER